MATAIGSERLTLAEACADWALTKLAARKDVHGRYKTDGSQYTAREPVTKELLVQHFLGEITIGLHSTSPDGRCLSAIWDIDAHDEKADPEANWRCALRVVELCADFGLTALIFDSNGKGGYHVRCWFRKPVAVAVAYWLCERVKAILTAEGFAPCEAFPKQAALTIDRPFGNWVRIPGKHHKRDHWMSVYDAKSGVWLKGKNVSLRLLKVAGDDTAKLLAAYKAEAEAEATDPWTMRVGGSRQARQDGKPPEEEVRSALAALPAAMADAYGGTRADCSWLGVGMALHDWDSNRGLALWKEFSARSDKYDPAVCDAKWLTFTAGGGFTVLSIFKVAWANGWAPPQPQPKRKKAGPGTAGRQHEGNGTPDGETSEDRDEPTDPGPLREAAAAFTSFADVLRDSAFKLALARMELEDPSEGAAIVATLHEKLGAKFKARAFNAAMAQFRERAKREVYNEEVRSTLLGESIDDPHRLARLFLNANCTGADGRTMVYHREEFYLHDGVCYRIYKDAAEDLTATIKEEFDVQHTKALMQYKIAAAKGQADENPPALLKVTASILKNTTLALRSETALPWEQSPPCWMGDPDGEWTDRDPLEILSTQNTLVHLPTLETLRHTPRLFTPFALNYSWVVSPPKPERWNRFISEDLWPADPDSVRELQKWFGLSLTLNTSYQKILMLIGPPRSGKGTIVRVLKEMVGEHNVVSPSLPGLARPFGLWPLLDKSLCVFSDAHALGSPSDRAIVLEMLLKISGEDDVTVDRKYQQPLTTKLKTRLVFVGNQEPNFRDPTGALMSRLSPLQLKRSFKGKEDRDLTEKLRAELPGILRYYAVEGLEMLKEDGGFSIPASAKPIMNRMNEILNPAAVFVEDCIEVVHPDKRETVELPRKRDIFTVYVEWCKESKYESGSSAVFGRNLRSVPELSHLEDARDSEGAREWRYRGIRLNDRGTEYLRDSVWGMTAGKNRRAGA